MTSFMNNCHRTSRKSLRLSQVHLFWVLLIAAPLSAQQTVVYPDVQITNDHPITAEITVNVPGPDSAQVAAAIRAEAAIARDELKLCPFCGGSDTRTYSPNWKSFAYVECFDCEAVGPVAENHQHAAHLWNKRES